MGRRVNRKTVTPVPRSAARTTEQGYTNRNGQVVVGKTGLPGTDHNQYVYVLRCGRCGHRYGANGSDIWQRLCPRCGGGRPGLDYDRGVAEGADPRAAGRLDRDFPAIDMGPWPDGFSASREQIHDGTGRLTGGPGEESGGDR